MEFPQFKYSPNAYSVNLFEKVAGICSICHHERELKYTGSFYSTKDPDYICPWCIANGKAAEVFEGEFNDYCGIEGVSPDPNDPPSGISDKLLQEITDRTPSYVSWQQEVWLTHCNAPCAFIGYADTKTVEPYIDELKKDFESYSDYSIDIMNELTKDGHVVGYLFRCLECGKHKLHVD